jgi:hypothetical protein
MVNFGMQIARRSKNNQKPFRGDRRTAMTSSSLKTAFLVLVATMFGAIDAKAADVPTPVATQPSTNGSGPTVGGTSTFAGGTVTITLPNGAVVTTTTGPQGKWSKVLPAGTKGKVDVIITKPAEPDRDVGTVNVVSVGAPPGTTVTTVATLSAGSTATAFGSNFALTGGFSAFDTAADYDPASPTFGQISGFVPASTTILGTDGFGDTLSLSLTSNAAFTLSNLAPVWSFIDATGHVAGQMASITVPLLSGTGLFDGNPFSFTGSATGTETFGEPQINIAGLLDPAIDNFSFNFILLTGAGQVTGTILASGPEFIPEPSTIAILGAAFAGFSLVAYRSRPQHWWKRTSVA